MSSPPPSVTPPRPEVPELLARAQEISDLVRARAQETEANRRISDEVARRIGEAGLFRILQPAAYGGFEHGFDVHMRVTAIIGRGCGSTAWVYSITSVHQWMMASLPIAAQKEFWASPGAIAAGSYPPTGKTALVDGGYRISGAWSFASGCDVADWLFVGAMVPSGAEGTPPRHMFLLLPRSDATIRDDWQTMGLAGTGSKTITAEDLFVPAHRAISIADLLSGTGPGLRVNTSPLYRQSFLAVLPVALIAPILGMGEGALEDFIAMVKERSTRGAVAGANRRMAELAAVQSRVAEATASLDAARLVLERDLAETYAAALRGQPTPVAMRLRNRLNHAFSARLIIQAVDALFAATGGQGIYLDKPLQRVWRDAHAAASHLSLNWDAVSAMYGQFALGLPPQGQY